MKKSDEHKTGKDKNTEELETYVQQWKDKYLRALADYQNLEKRIAQSRVEEAKYAAKNLIVRLLPVLDTLTKAHEHLQDQGLTLAIKQFSDLLAEEKVEKIEVMGKKFDPHKMECIEVIGEGDEVTEEVRAGYKMHDQVIRVARVKVGKQLKIQN